MSTKLRWRIAHRVLAAGHKVRFVAAAAVGTCRSAPRIKLCYGVDRVTFEANLLAPIRNYASFVNLLPAEARQRRLAGIGGLHRRDGFSLAALQASRLAPGRGRSGGSHQSCSWNSSH
jgi:hypothetical protein